MSKTDDFRSTNFELQGEAVREFPLPDGGGIIGCAADSVLYLSDYDLQAVVVLMRLGPSAIFASMDRAAVRAHIQALERSLEKMPPKPDPTPKARP